MLRRAASAIALVPLNPDASPYRDGWHDEASEWDSHQPEENALLCERCQNFDIQSFRTSTEFRKGYLLTDVEREAGEGCMFCALLLDAVKNVEPPEYFYSNTFKWGGTVYKPELWVHMTLSESYLERSSEDGKGPLRANRLLIEVGDRYSGMRNASKDEICLAADPESPAAQSGDVVGRYIGQDPLSDAHINTIKSWIEGCAAHEKCTETVSGAMKLDARNASLPSRVIEVSSDSGRQQLRLCETDGILGAYITLTHRWNKSTEKCITTMDNLELRKAGGDFGLLPQLFLDAFILAERLEIKYIWIDSLCIIQRGDEYKDWKREAPKMAQYYQYSIFTLAGTAEEMSSGVLKPYAQHISPWATKLVQLPYRDKSGQVSGSMYAYKRSAPIVDEYMWQVRSSILFQRGWILQEWLLSKRLLWFTPHGLFYECQNDLPRAYDQSQIAFSRATSDLQAHLQLKASFHHSNRDILAFWYKALEVYSGQYLTKPEMDHILAASGLAKEVAPILANPGRNVTMMDEFQNEVYAAGLWLRDIHYGLLWEEDHKNNSSLGRISGFPSWSWASQSKRVRWSGRSQGSDACAAITGLCFEQKQRHGVPDHIVYDNCRLRPFNLVGEAPHFEPTNKFSCLHMRARLHVVHVRGYLDSEENLKKAAYSTGYAPIPTACNWRAVCSAYTPEIIAGWASLEQMEEDPRGCSDFGIAVYALHLATRYIQTGYWLKTAEPVLDVLFVRELADRDGVYERVGVGRIADSKLIAEFDNARDRDIQLV